MYILSDKILPQLREYQSESITWKMNQFNRIKHINDFLLARYVEWTLGASEYDVERVSLTTQRGIVDKVAV